MTTKISTHLSFHNVCAVTITKSRLYNRTFSPGEVFYSNEIVLTDEDGCELRINLYGDKPYTIKVVED